MTDSYMRDLLRIAIAQICQTIGYNATQTTPQELLEDVLHKFLQEFCRDLRRQTEHYNRTEVNLNDVVLTLKSLRISASEIFDYINNVEPVAFPYSVPKFPRHTETNLNFLRPGCKEYLSRSGHIDSHYPPMVPSSPPQTAHPSNTNTESDQSILNPIETTNSTINSTPNIKINPNDEELSNIVPVTPLSNWNSFGLNFTPQGCVPRELQCVKMTTNGSITPAIEGKLPSATPPDVLEKLKGIDTQLPYTGNQSTGPISDGDKTALKGSNALEREGTNIGSGSTGTGYTLVKTEPFDDNQTHKDKKNRPSNIFNSSAGNKKHIANHHQHHPPFAGAQASSVVSKLLRKAKKKNNSLALSPGKQQHQQQQQQQQHQDQLQQQQQQQPQQTINDTAIGTMAMTTTDPATDKMQRKCIKILHKLGKTKNITSVKELFGSDGKFKGVLGPPLLAMLPAGTERQQLEKLFRKMSKHKQKLLKQQISREGKARKMRENQQLFTPDGVIVGNKKSSMAPPPPPLMAGDQSGLGGKQHMDGRPLPILPAKYPSGSNSMETLPPANIDSNTEDLKQDSAGVGMTKGNSLEIKLSTEPNRSKLNIFKKITKQKKSPNVNKLAANTTMFEDSEGPPVINLPSGTTITPAPPTNARQHVYSPDVQIEDLKSGGGGLNRSTTNVGGFNSAIPGQPFNPNEPPLVNKPKKRGRKPGQKNHPKTPAQLEAANNLKKSKKMKLQQQSLALPTEVTVEPLNLTSGEQPPFDVNRYDMMSNFGTGGIPKPMMLGESMLFPVQPKEKKERKKRKNIPPNQLAGDLGSLKENPIGPTKEEVSLINEKLLRMDTVMKSTVPGTPVLDFKKGSNEPGQAKSTTSSPNKSASSLSSLSSLSTSPSSSKSPSLKKKSQPKIPLGPRLGPMPSPFMPPAGLSNLQGNMLPMMQLYPFPPRPGLIPTPGLFPSGGFTNFPNPVNPSSMLLGGFLPFSNLKPVTSAAATTNSEKPEDTMPPLPPMGDRGYCNVAPLVPESMKLTPPDTTCVSPTLSKGKRDDREGLKASKSKHQSGFGDQGADSFMSKKPDSKRSSNENKGKGPSNTDNGLVLHDTFGEKGGSTSSSYTSLNPFAAGSNVSQSKISSTTKSAPNLGTVEAPIEVSDDSVGVPADEQQELGATSGNKSKSNLLSPGSDDPSMFGKLKKTKKSSKSLKKHGMTEAMSINPPLELFALEKTSKLAGGADLITLPPNTPLHSLKGPPYNSGGLIAAPVTPSFTISKKDNDKPSGNFFENITITSSSGNAGGGAAGGVGGVTSDGGGPGAGGVGGISGLEEELQKRRKEHKKLKKTKEGKMKKKKDKKDKNKSKDRSEKHLLKAEKILKERDIELYPEVDFIKKLKKEKKREKQRMAMEAAVGGGGAGGGGGGGLKAGFKATTSYGQSGMMIPGGMEKPHHQTVTASPDSTSNFGGTSTALPKLTLKIGISGDRDKKELSPELARISPLITRPPKVPKLSSGADSSLVPHAASSMMPFAGSNEPKPGGSGGSGGTVGMGASGGGGGGGGGGVGGHVNNMNMATPPNPWYDGGTISASSVLLPQQLMQAAKMKDNTALATISGNQTGTTVGSGFDVNNGNSNAISLGGGTAASGAGNLGNINNTGGNTIAGFPTAPGQTDERSSTSRTAATLAASTATASAEKQSSSSAALIPEANRPSSYIDAEGNRVWICPACGKVDDGSAMIGCDGCDAWYHWVCVGIFIAPKDNEDWFCRVCITKRKGASGSDKKRKRTKKK